MNRRGFLLGLTSALAAPAIVHAGNLMPVKIFSPYYTRYLVDYCIGTDELMLRVDRAQFPLPIPMRGATLRVDRAQFPLPIPMRGATVVSPEFAHRFIPRAMIDHLLKPTGTQQVNVTAHVTYFEALQQSKELWGAPCLS